MTRSYPGSNINNYGSPTVLLMIGAFSLSEIEGNADLNFEVVFSFFLK
tara:strand:+ start:1214 stop:1357 length:144 start_codon:yes stop_codon:yes gene_type:complete